jgi:hypothetical protein
MGCFGMGTLRAGLATGMIVAALIALLPAAASAATTYVAWSEPTGSTECTDAAPCTLAKALSEAGDGDAVRLQAGEYTLPFSGLRIEAEIDFGGTAGAVPVIETTNTATIAVGSKADATVHDLHFEGLGPLLLESGSAQRVFVDYTGPDNPLSATAACELNVGTTLRDSVCWAREGGEETEANGVEVVVSGEGITAPTHLRNVTAIAADSGGNGLHVQAGFGARFTVDGIGVIARASTAADVSSGLVGASNPESHVALSHSNYATVAQELPYGSVTMPGTEGNQTAAPVFADLAGGDFHELAASPTIDGGLADSLTGASDLDGHLRAQAGCFGGASVPDIGAFERTATAACPPPPPPPPQPVEPPKPKFRIVKVTAHGAGGSMQIETPGPGKLTLTGLGIKLVIRETPTAQVVTMPIRPWAITRVRLNRSGKTRVRLNVTFTPTSGASHQKSRGLLLKKG